MLLKFPLQRIFNVKLLPLPPVSDPEVGQPALAVGLLLCRASYLIKRSSDENIPKIAVPSAIASLLFQEQRIYVSTERLSPNSQQWVPAGTTIFSLVGVASKIVRTI